MGIRDTVGAHVGGDADGVGEIEERVAEGDAGGDGAAAEAAVLGRRHQHAEELVRFLVQLLWRVDDLVAEDGENVKGRVARDPPGERVEEGELAAEHVAVGLGLAAHKPALRELARERERHTRGLENVVFADGAGGDRRLQDLGAQEHDAGLLLVQVGVVDNFGHLVHEVAAELDVIPRADGVRALVRRANGGRAKDRDHGVKIVHVGQRARYARYARHRRARAVPLPPAVVCFARAETSGP